MEMIECRICRLEVEASAIVACSNGCQFCEDCVRQTMTNEVFEQRSARRVAACKGDCDGHYSPADVARLLPEHAYQRLSRAAANEEVWAIAVPSNMQYYHCRDCEPYWIGELGSSNCPLCEKAICGGCWEDIPDCRCGEEDVNSDPEARSKAVIRKCPRCRTPFVKEVDGCNHVICSVCEADICYYCGEWFQGTSIYDEHFGEEDGRCPMYSSYETLHDERAAEAAQQFRNRLMEA